MPGIQQAIAEYDGVKPENVMITAGSGEVLRSSAPRSCSGGKKVLGVEPTYNSVYSHATNIKSEAIKLPLTKDYRQDIGRSSTRPRSTRAKSASSTSATRTTRPA